MERSIEASRLRAWGTVISGVLPSERCFWDRTVAKGLRAMTCRLDEPVPELLEGGAGLVPGAGGSGQLLDEAAGRAWGDPCQFEILEIAPVEEPPDGP